MAKLVLPEQWDSLDLDPCCGGSNVKRLPGPISPLVYSLNQIGINAYTGRAGSQKGKRAIMPLVGWKYYKNYFPFEAGVDRVMKTHEFDWIINPFSVRGSEFHELAPRSGVFQGTREGITQAQLQSIDLAMAILQDFGLKEDDAVDSMRKYQEQLRQGN